MQMAPKRPLYGDFTAAHAGILRRADNLSAASLSTLPLPPVPAAISPVSSAYTSPIYSHESRLAPSPLAVQKAPAESRFSLKQLTRSLTQRLARNTSLEREHEKDEELQQLRNSSMSGFSIAANEEPLRPLEQTYTPTNPTFLSVQFLRLLRQVRRLRMTWGQFRMEKKRKTMTSSCRMTPIATTT